MSTKSKTQTKPAKLKEEQKKQKGSKNIGTPPPTRGDKQAILLTNDACTGCPAFGTAICSECPDQ